MKSAMSCGVSPMLNAGMYSKPAASQKSMKSRMPQPLEEWGYQVPAVGRTAVARADHLLPAVFGVVDHRAAVAQHGDALVDQRLGHIAAHRQALEPSPFARLEEGVAQRRPSRAASSLSAKRPAWSRRCRRQREVHRCQSLLVTGERRLRVDLRAVAALQRRKQRRWVLGPRPHVTLVGLAGGEVHAPAIESLVLDAAFALAGLES